MEVLWISRIAEHKKPRDFVRIAEKMPQHNFILIGRGDPILEAKLSEYSNKLSNFKYLGYVTEEHKDKYLRKCDIYVSTSVLEGFGLTLLEALERGKPVVAKPLEVFKEIYDDIIIYARSIDEFSERIKELENATTYNRWSTKALEVSKTLKSKYSWKKAAENINLNGRVLALCDDDPRAVWGGYIVFYNLLNFIVQKKVHVRMIAPLGLALKSINPKFRFKTFKDNSRYNDSIFASLIFYLHMFFSALKTGQPSFIFCDNGRPVIVAYILSRIFRRKLFVLMHDAINLREGYPRNSLKVLYKVLELKAYHASTVLTVSGYSKKQIEGYGVRNVFSIWK